MAYIWQSSNAPMRVHIPRVPVQLRAFVNILGRTVCIVIIWLSTICLCGSSQGQSQVGDDDADPVVIFCKYVSDVC